MRRVFFAGLSVCLLLTAMYIGGSVLYFINLSALLVVFFGTMTVSLLLVPGGVLFRVPALLCSGGEAPDLRRLEQVPAGLRRTQQVARCSGVVMCGLGGIHLLHGMADPTAIGPALASIVLGLLYSVMLSEGVLGPLANGLQAQQLPARPALPGRGGAVRLLPAAAAAAMLALGAARAGSLDTLIDGIAALYVVGLTACISLTHHTAADLWSALRAAIPLTRSPAAAQERHLLALSTVRQGLSLAGASGLLIGMVKLMASLGTASGIGPALAVASLPWLYAVVLAELILSPLITRLRGDAPGPGALAARGLSSVIPLGGSALCCIAMLLLTVSIES